MGLLDLFRPKWKHSRAEVRLEAVKAMSEDDLSVLREIARRDPESKIREAAMKRLPDAVLLSELASEERDENLRELASKRASELSMRTAIDATNLDDAVGAVKRISDPKLLVDVIRRANTDAAKREALSRITDQRALLDVVQKGDAELRVVALDKITEPKVLRDVAMAEGSTKALATKAIEKLSDQAALKAIVERGKSKAIRGTAKARMDALGFVETQEPKKEKPKKQQDPAAEARLKQRKIEVEMRRRAEEERKANVGKRKEDLEAEHKARMERMESEAANADARRAEEERAEEEKHAKRRAERDAKREAELLASETPEQTEARKARDAEKAARDEQKRAQQAGRAQQAKDNVVVLESLTERLEAMGKSDDLKEAGALMKEALSSGAARGSLPDGHEELRKRFEAARTKLANKLSALREAEDWKRFAAVPKLEALITRAEDLAKVVIGAIKLEEGQELDAQLVMRELKNMQAQWKEIGRAPRDKADSLWERFKAATDIIYEGNKKSLDLLDEERSANLKMKEELCARVEALVASPEAQENPKSISDQLKVMQEDWKKIGPVPRSENDKIWNRFRAAADTFFAGRKEQFQKQDEQRGEVLGKQLELVRRAESLAGSQDWKGTSDKLKDLQDQWKSLGAGKKGESDEAWGKFRAACDRFFEARKAHFEEMDGEREANFAKKEELVAKVEQLAKDESVEDPDAKIRELMAEWKKIGPVAKDKGDEVWARFGKALDMLRSPQDPEEQAAVVEQANVGWKAPTFADKLKAAEKAEAPKPEKKPVVQAKAVETPVKAPPEEPKQAPVKEPPPPAEEPKPQPVKEPVTPKEEPPSPVEEPQKPAEPVTPPKPPVEEPPAPPAVIPAKEPIGEPAPKEPEAPKPVPQEVPAPSTPEVAPVEEPPAEAPTTAQDSWPAPEDWSLPDDNK